MFQLKMFELSPSFLDCALTYFDIRDNSKTVNFVQRMWNMCIVEYCPFISHIDTYRQLLSKKLKNL